MRVAIVSGICGGVHPEREWVEQALPGFDVTVHRWNDRNFAPRTCALQPRLQARIVKCFGWEMAPGADIYVYLDGSFTMERSDSVAWLIYRLDDWVGFKHPARSTIRDEVDFMRERAGSKYLRSRYDGENLDLALAVIPPNYTDNVLYATGVFAYRDSPVMRQMLTEWWLHQSRYHLNCQLSLPFLLWKHRLRVGTVEGDIYQNRYFVHTQNRAWKAAHEDRAR